MDVVIGASNPNRKEIVAGAANLPGIHFYSGLSSLAPLMAAADLALGAGGATTWERCCLGLPTIVVTLAANQVPIAHELNRQGLVRWLGDVREVDPNVIATTLSEIAAGGVSGDCSGRCMELVDGIGCRRVVEAMLS